VKILETVFHGALRRHFELVFIQVIAISLLNLKVICQKIHPLFDIVIVIATLHDFNIFFCVWKWDLNSGLRLVIQAFSLWSHPGFIY
jgi:hypothetical protein